MKKSCRSVVLMSCLGIVVSLSIPLMLFASEESDRALRILDRWTSLRWGDGNLAWVVHYPAELVDPWVRSEAKKRKLRPDQTEAYRKSFEDELRIGSATASMLSVYVFDQNPLKLSPLSKNIVLIDSSGRRIPPIVFEKKLDNPLKGLVQGFVFFPKQRNSNFRIAVKGLKSGGETIFSFGGNGASAADGGGIVTRSPASPPASGKKTSSQSQKEVVVRIPTVNKPVPPKTPPSQKPKEPEFSTEGEVYKPTRSSEPHSSSADLSLDRAKPVFAAPVPFPDIDRPPERSVDLPKKLELREKEVLELFLKAWIGGNVNEMYSLLSAESRKRVSKERFEREVMSGGFRQALARGYRVSWNGKCAQVSVARKMILFRAVDTKRIDFVEEDGAVRVSW